MSSLAAFVVATSSVLGQAAAQEDVATPERLSEDYIVGSWNMEGEIGGSPLKGSMRVRPGADGFCLIYDWRFKVKGMEPLQATAVGGLNLQTNRYCEYCFNSMGDHWINSYPADEIPDIGTSHGERTGTIKGKPYKGTITIDRKSRDEFVYSVQSGDATDMKYIFKRAKQGEAKPEATKQQFKELASILVGNWIVESKTEIAIQGICEIGDKYLERTSYEWVSNQTALLEKRVYEINDMKVAEGTALIAWNAPKSQIQATYVDSLGGSWHSVYTKTNQGFRKLDMGVFGDGRASVGRVDATVSSDGKTIAITLTNRVIGDKKLDDKDVVIRRVVE